jgi:hypothetical protein
LRCRDLDDFDGATIEGVVGAATGRVSKMETFVGYCQMVEATQCAMEADKERE